MTLSSAEPALIFSSEQCLHPWGWFCLPKSSSSQNTGFHVCIDFEVLRGCVVDWPLWSSTPGRKNKKDTRIQNFLQQHKKVLQERLLWGQDTKIGGRQKKSSISMHPTISCQAPTSCQEKVSFPIWNVELIPLSTIKHITESQHRKVDK